jgi:hypothetical protein
MREAAATEGAGSTTYSYVLSRRSPFAVEECILACALDFLSKQKRAGQSADVPPAPVSMTAISQPSDATMAYGPLPPSSP